MYGTILSGMSTAMHALGVISNNVANSGSTAFQKSDTTFADMFSVEAQIPRLVTLRVWVAWLKAHAEAKSRATWLNVTEFLT